LSRYLLTKYPWLRQTKLVDAGTIVVARTNCGSEAEAQRIADAAVESGLVACANIHGPIRSVYRWQGKVERAEEWVIEFKTAEPRPGAPQLRSAGLLRPAGPGRPRRLPDLGGCRDEGRLAAWWKRVSDTVFRLGGCENEGGGVVVR